MSKGKKYDGHPPSSGELVAENDEWMLFYLFKGVDPWLDMKLVSKHPRLHKANYWVGWNGDRFANSQCMKILNEYNPKVIEWMVEVLS